jgi:SAM-dependent methyltransferase
VSLARHLYAITWAAERTLVPGNRYSQYAYEEMLEAIVPPSGAWLDLGCGHRMLPEWRNQEEAKLVARGSMVVGIDTDAEALRRHRSIRMRARADIGRLPFAASAFDLVTANMVVEHLADAPAQFREITRVLRPGGRVIFHTPNANGYIVRVANALPDGMKKVLALLLEDRKAEDVYPTHYQANTRRAIAALAESAGLDLESCSLVNTSPVFSVVPPLAFFELLWIRHLTDDRRADLRTNIIAVLRKPA